ncbi:ABC transporter permease [Microbacteriaceae bacterium 4G12]
MNNLIQAELFKLRRNKAFWTLIVLLSIGGICYTTLLYLASKGIIYLIIGEGLFIGGPDAGPALKTSGSEILMITLFQNPFSLTLIMSTLAGFFISNDYATGVMKNTALSGNSRIKIFIAKSIAFALGASIICCIWPTIATVGSTIIFGFGKVSDHTIFIYTMKTVCLYLLQLIAFSSIILLIAIVVEESGKAIIISIGVILFVYFGSLLLGQSFSIVSKLYQYTVFYQLYEIENPNINIMKYVLTAIGTALVFFLLGSIAFKKKEIK